MEMFLFVSSDAVQHMARNDLRTRWVCCKLYKLVVISEEWGEAENRDEGVRLSLTKKGAGGLKEQQSFPTRIAC